MTSELMVLQFKMSFNHLMVSGNFFVQPWNHGSFTQGSNN